MFDVLVVIPTLREQANLQRLLPWLFNALQLARLVGEVIVIDDDRKNGESKLSLATVAVRQALSKAVHGPLFLEGQ